MVEEMFECGIHIDKVTVLSICIISFACICAFLYVLSGHTSQISSIERKLDLVMKKLDMFASIIHIMSEETQDSFEAAMAKQAQKVAPMDNLEVQEIRAVDEETKEVVPQEEVSESAAESTSDLVEAEELK